MVTLFKRTAALWLAVMLLVALFPAQQASAAQITRFFILNGSDSLIAGQEYYPVVESDKASTTAIQYAKFEYSANDGATWNPLPISTRRDNFIDYLIFALPIDPGIVSVKLRVSAYFSPLLGSKTFSEKVIGPYKVLQPGDPTDLVAASNNDGSITLSWNDRSNMESYYEIIRRGPDGTKSFRVNNTMASTGKVTYVDKQTKHDVSTIYHYTVSPIIEHPDLPEFLWPGSLTVLARTNVPITLKDQLLANPDTLIKNLGEEYGYLVNTARTVGDLYQVAVSGVKLNKQALFLRAGRYETLSARISPSTAANQKVTWFSDNTGVAEVDANGRVYGKAPGIARITVKTDNGQLTDVCVVTVSGWSELEMELPDLGAGVRIFDPTITPIQPQEQDEIDSIRLQTAIMEREASLSMAKRLQLEQEKASRDVANNGESGGLGPIAVGYVYISYEELTMLAGTSRKLDAIVAPSDASNQNITWTSSNTQVAAVDSNGMVTARSPGTATITVRTQDGGFTNQCVVTVTASVKDIADHEAQSEIMLAVAEGVVSGYPDQSFKPDNSITRAEFTVMLINGLNPATTGGELLFKDKNKIGAWATRQVAQAVDLGIISGYADGTFRPDAKITRAEMIAMVIRAYGEGSGEAKKTGYKDDAAIPDWARASANTAEETGIIIVGGKPIDRFQPQALATRAEAASSIVRMLALKN